MPAILSPAHRAVGGAARLALWALLGVVIGLAGTITVPTLFGYRTLNVLTGSMRPALPVGSTVIDETVKPRDIRVGDIVTFPDPERHGHLITHRVRAISLRGSKAYVVTRGDANDTDERWNVSLRARIGRVAYDVPMLGYVRQWISGPPGRLALVGIALLWGIVALTDIWRPRRALPQPSEGPASA